MLVEIIKLSEVIFILIMFCYDVLFSYYGIMYIIFPKWFWRKLSFEGIFRTLQSQNFTLWIIFRKNLLRFERLRTDLINYLTLACICISYKNLKLCIEIQNEASTTTSSFDDLEVRRTSMSSYMNSSNKVSSWELRRRHGRPPRGRRRYDDATP